MLPLTEEQRIAIGFPPQTWRGWWIWHRYWSPQARHGWSRGLRIWLRLLRRRRSR